MSLQQVPVSSVRRTLSQQTQTYLMDHIVHLALCLNVASASDSLPEVGVSSVRSIPFGSSHPARNTRARLHRTKELSDAGPTVLDL